MICWVGSTDLIVEFAISEAVAGSPVQGARVEVKSEGGLYAENFEQVFELVTDADGAARNECLRRMCCGTTSGLGITNTYSVHLPWWRFRVVAMGYESTDWADLNVHEMQQNVRRLGPGKARLVVPVMLRKSSPSSDEAIDLP